MTWLRKDKKSHRRSNRGIEKIIVTWVRCEELYRRRRPHRRENNASGEGATAPMRDFETKTALGFNKPKRLSVSKMKTAVGFTKLRNLIEFWKVSIYEQKGDRGG